MLGYVFELPQLDELIQMRSHNIYFYNEVDKRRRTVIKTMVLLNCSYRGMDGN